MKRKFGEEEKKTKKPKNMLYDIDEIKNELSEKGYCVVKGIMNTEKTLNIKEKLLSFLCGLNKDKKLDKENRETWNSTNWPYNIHGIIKNYGVGHCQALWDVRGDENIIQLFADLHGTRELLVSFDGACVLKPKGKAYENIHTDQSPRVIAEFKKNKIEFKCYQGILNMEECGDEDGGLVVYEGSHLGHAKYFEKIDLKDNWYIYDTNNKSNKEINEEGRAFLSNYKRVKVNCAAGDFLLFDSRIAHTVTPSKRNHRIAAYVCMLPKSYSNEKEIKKRKEYFDNFRTTSHWPCYKLSMNPKNPRHPTKSEFYTPDDDYWKEHFSPVLTKEMLKLLG
jgi:ectoine hydroxylase-related dioxygenase (phytanoyl-CoA dioxygenase family)